MRVCWQSWPWPPSPASPTTSAYSCAKGCRTAVRIARPFQAVSRYGAFVLLRRPVEPATYALWYVPPPLAVMSRRLAGGESTPVTDRGPTDPVPPAVIARLHQVKAAFPDQQLVLWYLGLAAAQEAQLDDARHY